MLVVRADVLCSWAWTTQIMWLPMFSPFGFTWGMLWVYRKFTFHTRLGFCTLYSYFLFLTWILRSNLDLLWLQSIFLYLLIFQLYEIQSQMSDKSIFPIMAHNALDNPAPSYFFCLILCNSHLLVNPKCHEQIIPWETRFLKSFLSLSLSESEFIVLFYPPP